MADISKEINDFRVAVYGRDVRESMISLAEKVNGEVETNTANVDRAVNTANTASSRANQTLETAQEAINEAETTLQAANTAKTDAQSSASAAEESASAAEVSKTAAAQSAEAAAESAAEAEQIAEGLGGFDGSAASVTAVDTQGLVVGGGKNTNAQALFNALALKVAQELVSNTKLAQQLADYVKKTDIVQTESTATNKVPSSAYLKQVKDSIDSNLSNKNIIGTYNIPNITGVSTAPENIAGGYHNVAKYSNGQCMYSALVYVYTSAISNSVIGTISSQYAPKQDISAYVYDFAGKRFLMILISSNGTIKLLTLEGTSIPESAVKVRGSIVF